MSSVHLKQLARDGWSGCRNPFVGHHRTRVVAAMSRDYARRTPRRRALSISAEDATINSCNHRGGAMMDAELLVDVVKVPLHCSSSDVKSLCYLVVFEALYRKFENLQFAAGQGDGETRLRG